jgi:hypothetical protein
MQNCIHKLHYFTRYHQHMSASMHASHVCTITSGSSALHSARISGEKNIFGANSAQISGRSAGDSGAAFYTPRGLPRKKAKNGQNPARERGERAVCPLGGGQGGG